MKAADELGLDLDHAMIEPGKVILWQVGTTNVVSVPVDAKIVKDLCCIT